MIAPLLTFAYNWDHPRLAGIPFFYWFQIFLVLFAAVSTAVVYRMTK